MALNRHQKLGLTNFSKLSFNLALYIFPQMPHCLFQGPYSGYCASLCRRHSSN